jgi:hypothetical protein
MNEVKPGLKSLGFDNAVRLRWVLRDINGKRLKWSPQRGAVDAATSSVEGERTCR